MFKEFNDYLKFIEKLKEENFKVKEYVDYCTIESHGYEIACVDYFKGMEIVSVNYLLFNDEVHDDLYFKEVFIDYNKLIDFILENTYYKGE